MRAQRSPVASKVTTRSQARDVGEKSSTSDVSSVAGNRSDATLTCSDNPQSANVAGNRDEEVPIGGVNPRFFASASESSTSRITSSVRPDAVDTRSEWSHADEVLEIREQSRVSKTANTQVEKTRNTADTSERSTGIISSESVFPQSTRVSGICESTLNELINRINHLAHKAEHAVKVANEVVDEMNRSKMRSPISSEIMHNMSVERVNQSENQNNIFGNVRLPRGGWLKDPFEDLTFSGRNDQQNPMKFLRRFQRIARYEGIDESDQLHYFGKCLRGAASNWFDVRDPIDISEAFVAFKDYYWSDEQQARLRESIYIGRYNRAETKFSMAEYALDLSRQAKNLEPPLTEKEIIRCIRRHFGTQIMREIRPTTVSSVEEFIKLLDEIENDAKRDREDRNRKNILTRNESSDIRNRVNRVVNDQFRKPMTNQSYDNSDRYKAVEYHPNKFSNQSGNFRNNTAKMTEVSGDKASSSFRDIAKRANEVRFDKSSHANKKLAVIDTDDDVGESLDENGNFSCEIEEVFSNDEAEVNSEIDNEAVFQLNIIRTKEIIRDVDEVTREDQEYSVRSLRPYITVKFGVISVKCLVDTGAQISAISKSFFDKLSESKIDMKVVPIRKFNLVGAFSEKGEPIARKLFVEFNIDEKYCSYGLYIVKNLSYDMVLGLDFLSENEAKIYCRSKDFSVDFDRTTKIEKVALNVMTLDESKTELDNILNKYEAIFRNEIGRVNNYQHEIQVTSNAPFKSKTYPIAEIHRDKVRSHLNELENIGIIERKATQYINPLVVVVKKNGEIRLCLDAREINKRMENDHEQPPTIDEIFRRIGSKRVFSTLDVAKAFWQIPLRKSDRKYTGFKFDNQTFVFKRMPFGLKTAGSSFMRAILKALGNDCLDFAIVYLDDILIASNSYEEHMKHLDVILEKLCKAGYKLNKEKCEFLKNEVTFLGHTFSEIKVEMNNDTKLAIENFARPRNKKAIQSFLGLVNWDRRFVSRLAELTKPLETLLCKETKFQWNDEQQRAFMKIKRAFREAASLYIIRSDYKFGLFIDASKNGLGARLFQYNETQPETKYTVAYASRSLRGAELNYTITELECLALVWALRKWHVLLLGRHIKIFTDHRALKFLSSCADDSSRIARWMAFLREFNLEICHIPGTENIIADTLSRNNIKTGANKKRDTIRCIAAIRYPDDVLETRKWVNVIIEAQNTDENLKLLLESKPEQYYLRDGIIRVKYKDEDRIVIPDTIKWKFINSIHDYLLHFGTDKIIDFASRYFVINNLERIVRDVVASCCECIATKYYTRPTRGLEYFDLPNMPGKAIALDLFGPLPQTPRGNKYILVVMDQFSKLTHLIPMKNQKLDTIMRVLDSKYFDHMQMPEIILTDNAGQFITDRWSEYLTEKGVGARKTSPYNPQANPVERVMRELGRIIRLYAHDRQTSWDKIVERAEKTINSTEHRSTGVFPYMLHPELQDRQIYIDPRLEVRRGANDNLDPSEQFQEAVQRAQRVLHERARQRKVQSDKHGEADQYAEGTCVWVRLHRRSDASRRLTRKIHLVYEGPFVIVREVRRNAYLLSDFDDNIVGVFNSRQLRPHREPRYRDTEVRIDALSVKELGKSDIDLKSRESDKDIFIIRDISSQGQCSRDCVSDSEYTRRNFVWRDELLNKNIAVNSVERIADGAKKRRLCHKFEENSIICRPDLRTWDISTMRSNKYRDKVMAWKIPQTGEPMPITEKGWRHMKRLIQILHGGSDLFTVDGFINDQPGKIILDTRGDFDVLSAAAFYAMKKDNPNLTYINDPEDIPAYFKQQRNLEFQAVECNIKMNGYTIGAKPMIIPGRSSAVILGRYSFEKMCYEFADEQEKTYKRRTMLRKGFERIQAWAENRNVEDSMSKRKTSITKTKRKKRSVSLNIHSDITDSESDVSSYHRRIRIDNTKKLWSSEDDESNIEIEDFPVSQKHVGSLVSTTPQKNVRSEEENKENQPIVCLYRLKDNMIEESITKNIQEKNIKDNSEKSNDNIINVKDNEISDNCVRTDNSDEKRKNNNISLLIEASQSVSINEKLSNNTDAVNLDTVLDGVTVAREKECERDELGKDTHSLSCSRGDGMYVDVAIDNTNIQGAPSDNAQLSTGSRDFSLQRSKSFSFSDSLWKLVARKNVKMSAGSSREVNLSQSSIESLSTSELIQKSQEIRERIKGKLRAAKHRRQLVDEYKALCLAEMKLASGPSFEITECEESTASQTNETFDLVMQSFVHSTGSRVVTDNIRLLDKENNPLYSMSTAIAFENLQPADKEARPINIQYFLRGGRIFRSYSTHEPEFIAEYLRQQSTRGGAQEIPRSVSSVDFQSIVSSTPVCKEKPRVISNVEINIVDPDVTHQEADKDFDVQAVSFPAIHRHFAHEYFGEEFMFSQSIDTISQCADIGIQEEIVETQYVPSGSSGVGWKRTAQTEGGVPAKRHQTSMQKESGRSFGESRQDPLAGEMQPVLQMATITRDRPPTPGGSIQPVVKLQRTREDSAADRSRKRVSSSGYSSK